MQSERATIAEKIRKTVILEGLELGEMGITLDQIGDDTLLFGVESLDLDSVDALEIVAGVQREFGLSFPNVDQAFMKERCATVAKLADLVLESKTEKVD
ncbi:acyl carrier protein [Verminephrobacter aporrectodeae]|uniref:acyl carrier protein n=1 Tax=Verminephrobacter aporrectodeae TaxID=1110389 RepID=UPI000681ACFD|nr:acyl carrier protein [Verminephrobacter aporrectodeae]